MPDAAPQSILIIDDDQVMRDSLSAYLEDSGFAVNLAADGAEGLEAFAEHKPDLVLVDLRMPALDGLGVLDALAGDLPRTPVIVVSGTGVLTDAVEALRRGAWDYVIKPIQDMAVLEHAVNKALERSQLLKNRDLYNKRLEEEVKKRTRELTLANERISAQLKEKEVLLKEIHHRVKNNLQVISSLLYLQSHHIEDEKTLTMFMESRSRVRSMALVHEKLYQNDDLSRIAYDEYLNTFARHLLQTYLSPDKDITLELDLNPVSLVVDTAIPCSLVVNEVLTNSLKYAFIGRDGGKLGISLKKNGVEAVLVIWDDGPGLPEGFDYRQANSLGMQLIINLAAQLRARLSLKNATESACGVKVELAIPLPD